MRDDRRSRGIGRDGRPEDVEQGPGPAHGDRCTDQQHLLPVHCDGGCEDGTLRPDQSQGRVRSGHGCHLQRPGTGRDARLHRQEHQRAQRRRAQKGDDRQSPRSGARRHAAGRAYPASRHQQPVRSDGPHEGARGREEDPRRHCYPRPRACRQILRPDRPDAEGRGRQHRLLRRCHNPREHARCLLRGCGGQLLGGHPRAERVHPRQVQGPRASRYLEETLLASFMRSSHSGRLSYL